MSVPENRDDENRETDQACKSHDKSLDNPRPSYEHDTNGVVESPAPALPDGTLDEAPSLSHIIPRVLRNILVFGILFAGPIFWIYRLAGLIGFFAGTAVSYVNFRVLTRGVEGLADRIVDRHSREKGGKIVFRFLVRYTLVALVAYAIFRGSALAFRGFLWGLCVPVSALIAEAVWEAYAAFRR
jgi:hypothetical protein